MSLFKKILYVFALFATQGCGFQPVYNSGDQESFPEFAQIIINPIPNRNGQILRNHLLFALNPTGRKLKPVYNLNIKLSESTTSLAVRKSAFATRANLTVSTKFNLNRIKDNKSLYSGTSNITVSYNILDTEYATLAVKKNAVTRGLLEVSQSIHNQLGFYFSRIHN